MRSAWSLRRTRVTRGFSAEGFVVIWHFGSCFVVPMKRSLMSSSAGYWPEEQHDVIWFIRGKVVWFSLRMAAGVREQNRLCVIYATRLWNVSWHFPEEKPKSYSWAPTPHLPLCCRMSSRMVGNDKTKEAVNDDSLMMSISVKCTPAHLAQLDPCRATPRC